MTSLAGCEDAVSAEDQLIFRDDGFARDLAATFSSGDPVRVGSRFCPTFTGWIEHVDDERVTHDASEQALDTCFEGSIRGPGRWDGECIVFDGAGEVTWSLTPVACGLVDDGATFRPDELVFDVVDPGGVVVAVDFWRERFAERNLVPTTDETFPPDWRPFTSDVVGIAADRPVGVPMGLFHGESRTFVAWSTLDSQLTAVASDGSPQWEPDDDGRTVVVRMGGGDRLDVGLSFADGAPAPVRLVGTEASALATLEVVVAHVPRPDGGLGEPVGARAVVRTLEGRLVLGAGVNWFLAAGNLAVNPSDPGDPHASADYVDLADRCEPPPPEPKARSARLIARVEGLEAAADLRWIADPSEEDFEPSEGCPGGDSAGCRCRTGTGTFGGGFGLWTVGLAILFRRRHRSNHPRAMACC